MSNDDVLKALRDNKLQVITEMRDAVMADVPGPLGHKLDTMLAGLVYLVTASGYGPACPGLHHIPAVEPDTVTEDGEWQWTSGIRVLPPQIEPGDQLRIRLPELDDWTDASGARSLAAELMAAAARAERPQC